MFDLSIPKLLVLAVIALVIFGPHELPKIASQAGRALRDLRKIAEGAKNDLREGGDAGVPLVLGEPDSPAALALAKIADELGARRRGLAGRQLGLTPR